MHSSFLLRWTSAGWFVLYNESFKNFTRNIVLQSSLFNHMYKYWERAYHIRMNESFAFAWIFSWNDNYSITFLCLSLFTFHSIELHQLVGRTTNATSNKRIIVCWSFQMTWMGQFKSMHGMENWKNRCCVEIFHCDFCMVLVLLRRTKELLIKWRYGVWATIHSILFVLFSFSIFFVGAVFVGEFSLCTIHILIRTHMYSYYSIC